MSYGVIKKTLTALAGMHAVNTLINIYAKNLDKSQKITGNYYDWKNGRIFYRVKGHGSPVLLIHHLDHRFASYEWDEVMHYLSKNHRVYAIDLPGCGHSDKPRSVYTAYMFIQAIRDFTSDVIGNKPTVIASKGSAFFTIMANSLYENTFSKIILINPATVTEGKNESDLLHLAYKKLLFTPVIGTSVYNLENSSLSFFNKSLDLQIDERAIINTENAYIASHLNNSNGRFLYASKVNNYINVDVRNHLGKQNNIVLVFSAGMKGNRNCLLSYRKYAPDIRYRKIPGKSTFPHRDKALKTYNIIKDVL